MVTRDLRSKEKKLFGDENVPSSKLFVSIVTPGIFSFLHGEEPSENMPERDEGERRKKVSL
jgi:hypothetical protein